MGRMLPLAGRSTDEPERTNDEPTAATVLESCATPQRRVVLETLCEAGTVTVETLAERIVERREDGSATDVEDAREQVAIALHHNHLPQLSAHGLVTHSGSGRDASVALAPNVDQDRVRELIGFGDGNWRSLGVIVNDERRRIVAAALADADGDRTLDELAETVVDLERGSPEGTHEELVESVRVSLHHVHLPKLEAADVVEYNAERGLVVLDRLPEAYRSAIPDGAGNVPA